MRPLFREMERISQRFTTAIRGVEVVKTVWANDEGLSVVRFEITSERDHPVRLRLVESVPEGFPMENIGPHPNYGGDNWTKTDDHEFVYTDRLDAEGEAFTLYGIKELSSDELESFLTEAVVTIDPAGDEAANHSDDATTMTTEDTDDGGADDGTEQQDDFTRGGNFDSQIPRVEDLRSVSGGWGADSPSRANDSSDIQFVGSKASSDDGAGTPIELDDPTQNDDGFKDADGADADGADANVADADVADADSDASLGEAEGDDTDAASEDGADVDGDEAETADGSAVGEGDGDEVGTVDDEMGPHDGDTDADDGDALDDDDVADATPDDAEDERAMDSEDGSTLDGESGAADDESLVDTLVSELAERDLSDDEREVLRDALGVSAPTSVDVRLRHVQNRVDDLAAYTTALESFLDENGTAEQVIEDLQAETDAMRTDIEKLESALSASQEAIELVEQQVRTIEETVVTEAAFDEYRDEFEAHLDDLDERLVSESELDAQLADLSDELASVRDDVETGKRWRSNLSQAIQLPGMAESDGGETDGEMDSSEAVDDESESTE